MRRRTETYTVKDYRSSLKPIWCPGCGDYGVVTAIYRALVAIGRPPHESRSFRHRLLESHPGVHTAYGFNSVHGRALPIAQGIKLANPNLLVLVRAARRRLLHRRRMCRTPSAATST